ncbi:hypothetical protein [Geotalea uraniireducens]|uniref:DUF3300 domain-containing protein n=1 Tax=Geotalea uraniireducens (strain Rf4) TaxID=351605 RepID=A5GCF7_GEOUR|nr:hypothetical protein [Geotalea uraniireducens]ABQ24743.1 hypothetical protein Gura_0529 [Geotalea uraniireducens Rf4]
MKRVIFGEARVFVVSLLLLLMPAMVFAQAGQIKPGAPPIEQPLVSEGDFAVRLGSALAVTTTDDEVEAESRLGELGIAPRNGWIADYPVTPDIIVELQNSLVEAVASGKLLLSKDEAHKKLSDVVAEFGLALKPYTAGAIYEPTPASCENYPNPAVVEKSYTSEGAPVVTYYCPPPDYYSLYAWVPYPFWWSDLWFPGFFILHDFHRVVHVHRKVSVITNHFNDVRTHRVFRVDPVERSRGKTFAGIGVTRPKDYIQTGVPRGERTIFNAPRALKMPAGGAATPPVRGGERVSPVLRGGEKIAPAPRGGERITPPSGGVRISPPSGGVRTSPPSGGGRERR